ncbi:peptidase [Nostoc sp. HG1]|nr:peptidase [Nostoc sp. HG1]
MSKSLFFPFRLPLLIPAAALAIGMSALSAKAETLYNPIPMPANNEVTDTLSEKDIPTGVGGFSRDYVVNLKDGDQIVLDLASDQFDALVTLIGPDGATVGENDDGPDGTTNSLLFTRITRPGNYIVRVAPYAGQGLGGFTLKVTRLRPV